MTHRFTSKFRHFLYNTIINMKIKMHFEKNCTKIKHFSKEKQTEPCETPQTIISRKSSTFEF